VLASLFLSRSGGHWIGVGRMRNAAGDGFSKAPTRPLPCRRRFSACYATLSLAATFTVVDALAECETESPLNFSTSLMDNTSTPYNIKWAVSSHSRQSDSEADISRRIFGGLFFGVPNDGMNIQPLIPVIKYQPNRFLLES